MPPVTVADLLFNARLRQTITEAGSAAFMPGANNGWKIIRVSMGIPLQADRKQANVVGEVDNGPFGKSQFVFHNVPLDLVVEIKPDPEAKEAPHA